MVPVDGVALVEQTVAHAVGIDQPVIGGTAANQVIFAAVPMDGVGAMVALDVVEAIAAADAVVAALAEQLVGLTLAAQRVVAAPTRLWYG